MRHWDTRDGEHTATLCAPAYTEAELEGQLERLPEVVEGLLDAGVKTVAIDLPLVAERGLDRDLVSASRGRAVVLPRPVEGGAVGTLAPAYEAAVTGADQQAPQPSGHLAMKHSMPPREVLGAAGPLATGTGEEVWPLALQTLAVFEGVEAPAPQGDGRVGVGRWSFTPTHEYFIFMPYLIPFLHWDRPEEWSQAAGKVVFIGACRVDRELTRFGRQPGVVAHGELLETVIDDDVPRQLPAAVDVVLAALTWAMAWWSRRLVPRASAVGPLLVGLVGVAAVLLVSLQGVWLGLSGVALAAALGWIAGVGLEEP